MRYAFVTGCPRSGTTVLTRLLASHYSVVIGVERYKYLARTMHHDHVRGLITPELFEPDRFFDFRPTDSNIGEENFVDHYQAARNRFDRGFAELAGDKIMPPSRPVLLDLDDQFPEPKFVFIYRDPMAVANSWEARSRRAADNPAWPAHNDHTRAHKVWTSAFGAAEALSDRVGPERLFPLRLETLFGESDATFEALFAFLDLELWRGTRQAFEHLREGAYNPTPPLLNAEQLAAVRADADPELEARWDARALDAVAAHAHA
jgi:hypothetical protein